MHRIIFVFLDGVGLGPASENNPLSTLTLPSFQAVSGGQAWTDGLRSVSTASRVVRPIDATLGMEGLPQSGTGQATLFTGVNCAQIVGRHFGPFPHSSTHAVLDAESVFHKVNALSRAAGNGAAENEAEGRAAAFANAYPPRFFEWANGRGRWTVTTRACRAAGVHVRRETDLRAGQAVTADLTGKAWRDQLDLDVEVVDEAEAGRRLVSLSRSHALTVYEYYRTDKLGHGRLDVGPEAILGSVDRLFRGILDAFDPATDTLVVTSDHGNCEAMHQKTHTRNPVPLFVYGPAAPHFDAVTSLTGVTPAIVSALAE